MRRLVFDVDQLAKWATEVTGRDISTTATTAIGIEEDSRILAAVFYDGFNAPAIDAHIVSDGSRRWMTKYFLKVMFDYPFVQLGCKRITAPVRVGNKEAIKFVEKLGFRVEGRLRNYYPSGEDRLLYGMLKEECRYV